MTTARVKSNKADVNRADETGRLRTPRGAVADDQKVSDHKVSDQVVLRRQNVPADLIDTPDIHLTPRELEVLRLLAEGLGDAEIAHALHLSPRTVSERVSDMLAKFGLHNRTALAVYAVRHGLA